VRHASVIQISNNRFDAFNGKVLLLNCITGGSAAVLLRDKLPQCDSPEARIVKIQAEWGTVWNEID
jgi:hypothetical protein